MEPSETRDVSGHVIDITRDSQQPSSSTTNGTNARNTPFAAVNCRYLITFEFIMRMSQVIAAIVVLTKSKHEHPGVPLFTWVIVYACGCVAALPLLFCCFYYRHDPYATHTTMPIRLQVFEEVLSSFFAVWIIVGAVLVIAGGRALDSDAPNLNRLIPVLVLCNAIPSGIPLCLLCISSLLGLREHNDSGPHECTTNDRVVAAGTLNEHLLS